MIGWIECELEDLSKPLRVRVEIELAIELRRRKMGITDTLTDLFMEDVRLEVDRHGDFRVVRRDGRGT